MHISVFFKKFLTVMLLTAPFLIQGQNDSLTVDSNKIHTIYSFEIDEGIFPPAWRKFKNAMDEADSLKVDLILLKLNTYGGAVDVADDMRTRLLNSSIPTAVFITNNAASAGALISIACDSIYMTKEATIGAAVVVDQEGTAASEKYQSYFREKFRATAESKGRDPDIAEAMVNPDVHIEGVIDSGKILTFTGTVALENGYCEALIKDEKEIFERMKIKNYNIIEYNMSAVDQIIRFFTNPVVSGILLMVIFFGIFFELQTPGVGFPIVAAILGAIFYFTPLYMDGLAENWEILIFLVGLILIGLELFVIPGFGVAGISGIILMFSGLVLSLLNNVQFDFEFTPSEQIGQSVVIVLGSMILTVVLMFLFGSRFFQSPLGKALVLQHTQQADKGYTVDNFKDAGLKGKTGIAISDLRPAGIVEIEEDRFDAFTQGEYIEKGDKIKVIKAKGISLTVIKI